jgi:TATA-binding protein-associated factor Taf7
MGVSPYSLYVDVRSFRTSMHASLIKQMDNRVRTIIQKDDKLREAEL